MELTINISDKTLRDILMLQAVEEGREGNYIRVEDIVNTCRYDVQDKVLTLIMSEIKKKQGRKPTNNIY